MPFFDLLRHRKFSKVDKLAPRNTLHAARNRLYSWIVWYLRGLESISILMCVYTEVLHNLFKKHPLDNFLKLVKSTLSFLGDISQVQTDHEKLRFISSNKMFESVEMWKHLVLINFLRRCDFKRLEILLAWQQNYVN